eukprot:SAG22_NODE_1161_length_5307_cov_55.889593_7_plen_63_part_00
MSRLGNCPGERNNAGNYSVQVGIIDQPFNHSDTTVVPVGEPFDASTGDSQIVWDASIRAARR